MPVRPRSAAVDRLDDPRGLIEADVQTVGAQVAGGRTGRADDADIGIGREADGTDMAADQGPVEVASQRWGVGVSALTGGMGSTGAQAAVASVTMAMRPSALTRI